MHARRLEPAQRVRAKRRGLRVVAACAQLHLRRVRQVKGQVRGRRVALGRLGLQAAQHYLLQPGRERGAVFARRHRVGPQALAQPGRRARRAKRQMPGAQLVEHDADGKNIAARIAAHTYHLLGRYPGGRAQGFAQLLGQQIRVMRMVREAKVQQQGLQAAAAFAQQHIGRFEVQVHRVLFVQGMGRARHGHAQGGDGGLVQRLRLVQPVLQGVALHVFHDQIRHPLQVAAGDKAWHLRAAEHLQDVALHLEADDVFSPIAAGHARHFHGHRKARVGRAVGIDHAVNMRHAAAVQAREHPKAIEHVAVF